MTQAPAQLFGLRDRGELREGYHADVVIFDPDDGRDRRGASSSTTCPAAPLGCSPTRSACSA